MNKADIINALELSKARSAWSKGVKEYAIDLIDGLDDCVNITKEKLLNGASSWSEYSYGGCALIYDADIAEALCNPSELKARQGGEWQPSKNETWLDVQARALNQASSLILRTTKHLQSDALRT
tara:strand:+ start:205 stop:576 length:372 start_codon:yes stop_codon:yes gene_type:complete